MKDQKEVCRKFLGFGKPGRCAFYANLGSLEKFLFVLRERILSSSCPISQKVAEGEISLAPRSSSHCCISGERLIHQLCSETQIRPSARMVPLSMGSFPCYSDLQEGTRTRKEINFPWLSFFQVDRICGDIPEVLIMIPR